MFGLPHSEHRVILSSFVWLLYQQVTDRRTDGIAVANTVLALRSQCGSAVKSRWIKVNYASSYIIITHVNTLDRIIDSTLDRIIDSNVNAFFRGSV